MNKWSRGAATRCLTILDKRGIGTGALVRDNFPLQGSPSTNILTLRFQQGTIIFITYIELFSGLTRPALYRVACLRSYT